MILDMSPYPSALDVANGRLSQPVVTSDGGLASGIGANGENLSLGEFVHSVGSALLSRCAALSISVRNIFELRAKKQMVRVAAVHHVAPMAHAHPERDRAIGELPRNSVSLQGSWSIADHPVALRKSPGRPEPAVARFINLRPESFREWYLYRSHATSCGQVVRGACERDTRSRLAYFSAAN